MELKWLKCFYGLIRYNIQNFLSFQFCFVIFSNKSNTSEIFHLEINRPRTKRSLISIFNISLDTYLQAIETNFVFQIFDN